MKNCPAHSVVRGGSKVGTLEGASVKSCVNSWLLGFSVGAVLWKLMGTKVTLFCLSVSKMVHLGRIGHRALGMSVESLCETPRVEEKRKGVKMVERRHNISIWNMDMSSDLGEIW